MSLDGSVVLLVLWVAAAALAALYLLLFLLARRPVSLRSRRLGWFALAVFSVRLVLVVLGWPADTALDIGCLCAALLIDVALTFTERVWLLRAEAGELRGQIETACRGLFLQCAELTPGRFTLTARAGVWVLRLIPLSRRVQLVVLPRVSGPGKAALLVAWLSKQYPGPVPRFRIDLNKE